MRRGLLPHPPPTTTDLGLTLGQGPPARGAARGSAGKGDAGTRERAREGSESRKASDLRTANTPDLA
jgi:hypothetical protein